MAKRKKAKKAKKRKAPKKKTVKRRRVRVAKKKKRRKGKPVIYLGRVAPPAYVQYQIHDGVQIGDFVLTGSKGMSLGDKLRYHVKGTLYAYTGIDLWGQKWNWEGLMLGVGSQVGGEIIHRTVGRQVNPLLRRITKQFLGIEIGV